MEIIVMGVLEGKVIALAGVGGIGDGLARYYYKEGAQLVFGDIEGEYAEKLGAEIDPSESRALGTYLDGSQEHSIQALIDSALSRHGRLDGFHCNYAFVPDGLRPEGLDIPLDMFDDSVRVNLRGYFLCSRLAVPAMIETGGGAMLYTSSSAATAASQTRFAYAMCKAGIQALMRNVAARYGPQGIRANAIAPGIIAHHKFRPGTEAFIEAAVQDTLMKTRPGNPDDIAAMGAFLLSDLSGFISGQTIAVDGGVTHRP
jgi:NAD(P)-dependent dehydrogenase (short-subunit alcohol dehydrogenase family)